MLLGSQRDKLMLFRRFELVEVVAEVLGVIVADPCGVGGVDEGRLVAGEDAVAYRVFVGPVTETDDVLIVGRTVGENLDDF